MGAVWERADGVGACRVSARPAASAVVATGFPFRRKERLSRYLATMERALSAFEDLRRPGAACLDLAWTACGVFDGFFELGLAAWDVAAGGLLVQEAGGVVSDWDGRLRVARWATSWPVPLRCRRSCWIWHAPPLEGSYGCRLLRVEEPLGVGPAPRDPSAP